MKGDFHVRFRENAGVKFPCVTRLDVIIINSLAQKATYSTGNLLLIFSGLYVTIMTMGIMESSYGLIPMGLIAAILIIISAVGLGVVLSAIKKRTKTNLYRWFF